MDVRLLTSQRSFRELVPQPWRQVVRWTDKNVDAIVVNSAQVYRHMTAGEGVPPERLRLVHNALDIGLFQPPPHPRPRPQGSGASVVVGCVCVLRPEKDLPTLMRAAKKAARDAPGLRLVIVGSGPEGPGLLRLSGELGLDGVCQFVPATSNVLKWYQNMDIFVLPSLTEALSNSLMEAMSCKCAVIASSVGGNIELVAHRKTGLLFNPGDVDQLAAHILTLAQDSAERERLAGAARSYVEDRFASARIAGEFERIYGEFL
jgi:glycosyltransferase involved in cell wall biosynthesis